ncbi:MAG: DUF1540 domain-containing protein [Desulfotomaculales bacterium]
MNQHTHCLVNDCHYWDRGNVCKAGEIIVTSNEFGNTQPDRIDAKMAKELTPTPVGGSCMATCCKTYVPKGSEMVDKDSIQRMS